MSLRWRLSAAFLFVVVVAVGGGTAAHVAEVSDRLERTLEQQASRVMGSIRTELEQSGSVLDEELAGALRPGYLNRWLGAAGQVRFMGARARLQTGRLEILKVLGPGGTILTSGHWPASFGAVDPNVSTYRTPPRAGARLVDEATPSGSAPSLQRWTRARWGDRDVLVVAGRFLDGSSLGRVRATVGADLLALCRSNADAQSSIAEATSTPACVSVGTERGALDGTPFDPDAAEWRSRFLLSRLQLDTARGGTSFLVAGLDRETIEEIRAGMVTRAVAVGVLSVLLAMLLGLALATRILRPIEALASTAELLGEGDLSARADVHEGGKEVERLVNTFNVMASEIERSQQRLRQAERVAAWREIARGLAHELKNPLTPILGAMDVIRRAYALGRDDFAEILDEQADAVVEEVMRLKELSDNFARFARLPDPKPEPLLLSEVVDRAVALYAGEETKVTIARHYDAATPEVTADRTQVATAVTNLVKNAVEAMDGAGVLTVHIRPSKLDAGDAAVELRIEDNGPGIPADTKSRLFTPYFTTKGSRGTGLGLALVHRIIMEHAGAIEVMDASPHGAVFALRLPQRWSGTGESAPEESHS